MINGIAAKMILALIACNLLELAMFWNAHTNSGLYALGIVVPELSGYLLDNTFVAPRPGRCSLIRLSADGCPYCRLDQPLYAKLLAAARARNCESAVLGPRSRDISAKGRTEGAMTLEFVDFRLGKALKPVMTPETLLVNGNGRLAWFRKAHWTNVPWKRG